MLVAFGCSEFNLPREREYTFLCPSVYYVLVVYGLQCRGSMSLDSLVFTTSVVISLSLAAFLFFQIEFESSSICVNCLNWMSI